MVPIRNQKKNEHVDLNYALQGGRKLENRSQVDYAYCGIGKHEAGQQFDLLI